MNASIRLAAVVAAILAVRCSAAPPPPPPPPPATPAPVPLPTAPSAADLWDAPRAVLAEAGYAVVEEDRAKGLLVARRAGQIATDAERREAISELRRIAHLDDPRVGGAAQRMSEYAVTVRVRIGAAGGPDLSMAVKAEIEIAERAVRKGATVRVPHPVPSRGVLENELIAKIRKRLEE